MKKDWTKVKKIRGGHGYWRRLNDGAIGIADESGSYPEDCEPADQPPFYSTARVPSRWAAKATRSRSQIGPAIRA